MSRVDVRSLVSGGISPTQFMPAGALLPNPKLINVFQSALPIATTDLYTVPVGRRAAIYTMMLLNPTGNAGAVNWNASVKISGIYFPIMPSNNGIAVGALNRIDVGFCLEAGQTLALVESGNAGGSIWANIVEYDASAALRTIFNPNVVAGDNIVYTVPAGKHCIFVGSAGVIFTPASQSSTSAIKTINLTVGALTINVFLVPFGGVSGNGNQINPGGNVINANNQIGSTAQACLNAGDFVNVNSSGAGPLTTYLNVLEFPA